MSAQEEEPEQAPAIHPSVDMDAEDPALVDVPFKVGRGTHTRRCVARRQDGQRCGGQASPARLLCAIHDGRADPSKAALARKALVRKRTAAAEQASQLQRLGTRAVIAQTLARKATEVEATVTLLLDAASKGDLASAKAVIPFIDQALGRPTERHEVLTPSTPADVDRMEEGELEHLVAQGRAARLRALEGGQEEDRAREESTPQALSS